MLHDLRFALRQLRLHPWFSAAIAATLALGIGVNTTIFTLANAVLFQPLPFRGGDRMVAIYHANPARAQEHLQISYADYLQYREQSSSFESLRATGDWAAIISEPGRPAGNYSLARISWDLLDVLGVQPVIGRRPIAADSVAGADPVLLLSYGVWRDRYGMAPDVLGRRVRINSSMSPDEQATIIGVMPEGFGFPNVQRLWMPLVETPELEHSQQRWFMLVGIRKPGVSIEEARSDMSVITGRLLAARPERDQGLDASVQTFHDLYAGGAARLVFLLMLGAVACVLLIACANVANMMLSRALGHTRDVAIRAALGASPWRILQQLLVESVLLSFLGGAVGLVLARFGVAAFDQALAALGPPTWIRFAINYRVLAYFTGICVISGILFGLAPGLQAARANLYPSLKDGARTAGSRSGGSLSGALVVFQFALAVVLLSGAGLFLRAFLSHQDTYSHLSLDHVLAGRVDLPRDRYPDAEARTRLFEQLLPRLAGLPGIRQAAMVRNVPGAAAPNRGLQIEGQSDPGPGLRPTVNSVAAWPGYFSLIGLAILEGRAFDDRDGLAGREAAIVTSDFAARYWPHQSAVGKRLRLYPATTAADASPDTPGEWLTVVGVTGEMLQEPYGTNPDPVVFLPYRAEAEKLMTLLLRTEGDPLAAVPGLRDELQKMDAEIPLSNVTTLAGLVDESRWFLRVFGTVFGVFAIAALVMAVVGIYAVLAQATGRRTVEIGVRMALGATPGSVVQLVVSQGFRQVLGGLMIGLAAAVPATWFMGDLLVRTSPTDPLVFGTVLVVLAAVGLLGCWLPAHRAARMHPLRALRHE